MQGCWMQGARKAAEASHAAGQGGFSAWYDPRLAGLDAAHFALLLLLSLAVLLCPALPKVDSVLGYACGAHAHPFGCFWSGRVRYDPACARIPDPACCAGVTAAACCSLLLAMRAWPQQYAACRESLACAQILAVPSLCMLLQHSSVLSSLEGAPAWSAPAALCCAALQFMCLTRRVRLRTWATLLPALAVQLAAAIALPALRCSSAAGSEEPAGLFFVVFQVRSCPLPFQQYLMLSQDRNTLTRHAYRQAVMVSALPMLPLYLLERAARARHACHIDSDVHEVPCEAAH